MDMAFYPLIGTVVLFIAALIVGGYREPSGSLHQVAQSTIEPEVAERRYKKVGRIRRFLFLLTILSLLTAAALFVIPRLPS